MFSTRKYEEKLPILYVQKTKQKTAVMVNIRNSRHRPPAIASKKKNLL
jgi:hypothetical protein